MLLGTDHDFLQKDVIFTVVLNIKFQFSCSGEIRPDTGTLQSREAALERDRPCAVRAEVEALLAWLRGGGDAGLAGQRLVTVEVLLGQGCGVLCWYGVCVVRVCEVYTLLEIKLVIRSYG
jgi:hypothetical protein